MANDENHVLNKYMIDIAKHELLSVEDEFVLAKKVREGDLDALDALVKANLRFVVSVAKQYQGQGLPLNDLINDGNLGLMRAAQKFDETRGFRFISYAVWWIRQAMTQSIMEQSKIIRTPVGRTAAYSKVRNAFLLLEQEYQREPDIDSIAEKAGVSENIVSEYLSSILRTVSTDMEITEGSSLTVSDLIADYSENEPDNLLISKNMNKSIERIIHMLPERERDIITSYFGLGDEKPMTLEEIGERHGLTKERVRQLKERSLMQLKQYSRSKDIPDF